MVRNGYKQPNNGLEDRRARFLAILSKHIKNYQRYFVIIRRKRQQLLQNRRANLRKFYLLTFLELESRLLDMAPLIGANDIEQCEPNNWVNAENNDISEMRFITPSAKITRNPRRNLRFYEDVVSTYSDEKFFQTFRMSRSIFELLCNQLRDTLQPNTPIKNLISLETRCALSLYAFAAGDDYRVIASIFGISRTSVCKFTKKFAEVLLEKLSSHLLTMPRNEEEYREIRKNFQRSSGLPALCVGLVGACEINVSPQLDEAANYANVSGATTLIMQALVDDRMLFRKVEMEAQRPTLLLNTPNEVTKLGVRQFNEQFLPCFVIAPKEYSKYIINNQSSQTWLIEPYKEPKTAYEIKFNDTLKKLHSIKREAFQRLFSRWKILQRKGDLEPKTMTLIAKTCCALHNLLEEYEESFDYNWTKSVDLSHFDELTHYKEVASTSKVGQASKTETSEIRNLLAREMHLK